jgi:tetratricopeptide (TPR) repeat protein
MGGIGKTELVLQYAMKYFEQGTYPGGICWLRARDQEIATQILGYAQAQLGLTIPEQLDLAGQISYCWRNWSEGDALIVLEDVTAYKLVAPYLPPADPRFKLLLTTRLKLGSTVKDFPVEELDEGSAIELLVSFVGQERIQSELDDARGLCRWVGYLPLGLELIGRFLSKKLDWSLSRLQGQLETKRLAANALLNTEAGMTAQLGIIAALELSWQELNESEQALACLLGLFAVAPIPWKLVEQCCGAIDPDDLEESRDEGLISHSLLKRMREGSYQLHQIVQEYFRVKLQQISDQGQGQKKSFCRIMVEVAKSIDDTPTIEQIERVRDAIPHLEEVANEWASTFSDNDLIWPFIGIILFYKSQFAYHTSIFWGERFLQLAKERFTEEHSEFAYGLGYLADIYRIQGNYDKAEILNNQALKIRENLFGENHPQVANSFNKLAAIFCDQGRPNEAEALYEKASKIMENIFGENHSEVITSTNNLAVLYVNQGRYHEAEPLLTKVLEISKKLFGEAHPEVLVPTSNLAALYRNLGEYQNAELFHKLVITLKEDLFGKDHPKVATSLNNLAILYMDQNRPNDSEPLYERALKIGKDSLGEEHSEVATTINNLAHCGIELKAGQMCGFQRKTLSRSPRSSIVP